MALRDELIEEDCFKLEPGTPTLTIEQSDSQTMIPWINFKHAHWKDDHIQIHFHGWRVDILGDRFKELWQELQRQNVLSIHKSLHTETSGCFIRALSIEVVKKKPTQEEGDDFSQLELDL